MKSSTAADMSIGQIAGHFGLATHVLRHWESQGLLAPARAEAARRRYGSDDLYRIALILRAKEVGFGLDEIRKVMTAPDSESRREVLRRHHTTLARRIAEAQAALELIECALDCAHGDFLRCPHFQAAVAERIDLEPPTARPAPAQ
ncbi:MerR family transcriptional regulator [Nocardia uniformis]|uniref:MerR family transcriptional regulator n=1 Tax=Nocardia uniformis TaxID=53432 RepID=A0A849BY10_9NOCA|nr:MerR family transcriptional regulator [Nocardia uniformis]NNH70128.1 MerR family transcriptional regulator [Nocardia uniformis]